MTRGHQRDNNTSQTLPSIIRMLRANGNGYTLNTLPLTLLEMFLVGLERVREEAGEQLTRNTMMA